MTVTLDQATRAARNLTHPHPGRRAEAMQTVRTFLDEASTRALQEAFDLEPAPDGPPMERND